ncbi:MAG: D-hexose-6-phosphate mutarotase [Burkholderiales bacterium 68-12]|nr:MAG: D-hexose-6-phosphate mutarotase [Burkholderiales bacterium 68-12]
MPDPAPQPGQAETFRGQPCIRLRAGNGDTALVALHGAQVLSWIVGGRERLYLSPNAVFDGQVAIRGGIPLCFPQFNQRGPLPKHGFARNLTWRAEDTQAEASATRLALHLSDDERTRAWWPQAFAARVDVVLSAGGLRVDCTVRNTGAVAWGFTIALHSYLRVDDIAQACLQGLDGRARWDAVADVHGTQQGPIPFVGEYDSVFAAASAPLLLNDGAHRLEIAQSPTMGQTVVWNPGAALCARLPDMPADGHAHMLCVEATQIDAPVVLAPGATWSGGQCLRVL